MIRLAILLCVFGCGGKPAPQPVAPPIANTAPTAPAPGNDATPELCRNPPAEDKSLATPEMLVIYCKHVHDMCACVDTACGDQRAAEYHEARNAWSMKYPNASRDLSPDDKKFMDPLIAKMADCIHRLRGVPD